MSYKIVEEYPFFTCTGRVQSSNVTLKGINRDDKNNLSFSHDTKSFSNLKIFEEKLKKFFDENSEHIFKKEYNENCVNLNINFNNLKFTITDPINFVDPLKDQISNIYIFNNKSKSDPPIIIDILKKLERTLQILSYFNGSFEKTVHFLDNSDFNNFYFNDNKFTNSINVKYLFSIQYRIKTNKENNIYNISIELSLRQILIM